MRKSRLLIDGMKIRLMGDKSRAKKAMVKVMDSGEQVPVEFSKLLAYFQDK